MRVAITGGSGYLGSRIADELSHCHEVVICDVTPPDDAFDRLDRISYRECDVTRAADCESSLEDADAVVHSAGLKGGVNSLERPSEYYQTNVVGTVNVIEACRTSNPQQLLFHSTESVYGSGDTEAPFSEDDRPSPTSIYGATKHVCETYLATLQRNEDIETLSLRFPRVAGPTNGNAISRFATMLLDGETISLYGDGSNTLDFVHIDDVVRFHTRCLEMDWDTDICHVATDDAIRLDDLLDAVAATLDLPAAYEPIDRSEIDADVIEDDLLPHENALANDRSKDSFGFNYSFPTVKDVIDNVVDQLPREGNGRTDNV